MLVDVPDGYAVFVFRTADDVAEAVAVAAEKASTKQRNEHGNE
jgi:hypothetical protein